MIARVASHFRHGIASRKSDALRLGGQHGSHLSVVRSPPDSLLPRRTLGVPSGHPERSELAGLDDALARAADRARVAYDKHDPWSRRVRAALCALLELFDEEPNVARLCVVQSATIAPGALARREDILTGLARVIDEGRDSTGRQQPPPLTARGVVAGTIGAVRARLQQPDSEPLIALLNPLMSFIVLPYLGAGAARRELSRRVPAPRRERGPGRSSRGRTKRSRTAT
jgi:hypothetical protein